MNQVLELEKAILARAQQLADQYAEQAQRTRETILREAAERLRQREQREEATARGIGDRHYRQRVQAAELRLQSNLDRVRWNLVRGVESRLEQRMSAFIDEEPESYREYLLELLRTGLRHLGGEQVRVRVNGRDAEIVNSARDALAAEFPDATIHLDEKPIETIGGVLLLSADGRMRVDSTFEGRVARLRNPLQQAILERLLPAALESGNHFTG